MLRSYSTSIRFRQMALVDQSKAARLVGVTRQTISRKIRIGELSAVNRKIDTSELIRVYGAIRDDEQAPNTILQPDVAVQSELQAQVDTLNMKLAVKTEQLVTTGKDRDVWRYLAKTATENVKLITHQQNETVKLIADQQSQTTKPAISPTILVVMSVAITFTLCVSAFAIIITTR